jgi:hypothetical protein
MNKIAILGLLVLCLIACSKDQAPAPIEPVNTLPFVGRWEYNNTENYENPKTVELPGFEVEFLKDFTFVHYQNKKEIRRGKYELIAQNPLDFANGVINVPRMKYLDTGETFYYFYAKSNNRYELYIYINANSIKEAVRGSYHLFLRTN